MKLTIRGFEPRDRDWLVTGHAEYYARSDGFDASFRALVALIVDGFLEHRDPRCERGWILEGDAGPLGCVFCVKGEAGKAKLRLLFLDEKARGLGLGRRLLDLCIRHARNLRFDGMVLWTHESHEPAWRLYKANGWQLVSSAPARNFGTDVIEQHWELAF